MKVLATLTLLVSVSLCAQIYPGTPSRPILSPNEADSFTKATYLQGWSPPNIRTTTADYIVGTGGFSTIQAAVNAAVNANGTTRKYIRITRGTYNEVVYIPRQSEVPITLYAADNDTVIISLRLSAYSSGLEYKQLVGRLFKPRDSAYGLYSRCARKILIGTSCSSIIWARASNVQIVNVIIQNSARKYGTDQGVALFIQGDRTQVANCRLLGHQDTFRAGATGVTVTRGHVTNTHIEGDTDFVFGGGSTVFERCVFYVKSDRRHDSGTIFAPGTAAAHKFGFLVSKSIITGDSNWKLTKSVYLARSWDVAVRSVNAYVKGSSPNGQLVVRESAIAGIIQRGAPYSVATSGRLYVGNANISRNLNDIHFNKFWEFANTGDGA